MVSVIGPETVIGPKKLPSW